MKHLCICEMIKQIGVFVTGTSICRFLIMNTAHFNNFTSFCWKSIKIGQQSYGEGQFLRWNTWILISISLVSKSVCCIASLMSMRSNTFVFVWLTVHYIGMQRMRSTDSQQEWCVLVRCFNSTWLVMFLQSNDTNQPWGWSHNSLTCAGVIMRSVFWIKKS